MLKSAHLKSSNHWTFSEKKFQSLDVLQKKLPIIGRFFTWSFWMVWLSLAGFAQGDMTNELKQLEEILRQDVEIQIRLADEERLWRDEGVALKHQSTMLDTLITQSQTRIDRLQEMYDKQMHTNASLFVEIDRVEDERRRCRSVLEAMGNQWNAMAKGIPDSFARESDQVDHQNSDEGFALIEKMLQSQINAQIWLEEMQNSCHIKHELMAETGVNQEMTILYIGLSKAFAFTPDRTTLFSGRYMGKEGWTWEKSGQEQTKAVRQALNVFETSIPAALSRLPVTGTRVSE
ncbi:MAG: DUF3450 family protein [Spartobacteria bacterium]|nr:DUF3450 family protein [Spartobacteria bacterium]